MASGVEPGEPASVNEAFADQNWVSTMDSEYFALMKNQTWRFVLPP
jgi:hypothetical protein